MATYDAGMSDSAAPFHKLAKEAGNRLSAYLTNFAAGAVGVLFLAATQESFARLAWWPRALALAALLLAAVTVGLRLLELHVDAKRFYELAKQLERDAAAQDWGRTNQLKTQRLRLIWASYWAFGAALLALACFMLARVAV